MSSFLRKVMVGSGIMFTSMLIMKVMVFVNYIIAARLLTPDDYGAWSIVLNLQNFFVIVACFGIPVVMTKKVSEWVSDNSSMARSLGSALLTIVVVSSAVVALGYVILARTIAVDLYHDERLVSVFRLSALFVFVSALNMAMSALLQGCQRITAIAKINAVVAVLWQPLSFGTIAAFGLEGALLAQIVANALSAVLFFMVSRRALQVSFSSAHSVFRDREQLRSLISLTIPSFLSTVMIAPAYWIGRTVLVLDWGFSSVGQFQIAESLSQILLVIPAAMSIPLLPMISEQHARDAGSVGKMSGSLLRLAVFLLIPLSMGVMPVLEFVIVNLYGASYADAHSPAILMFAASALIAAGTVVSNVIFGVGRMWDALFLNLLWLVAFLSLVLYLVPLYGSDGLGTTYAISYAMYLILLLLYFRRKFGVDVARMGLYASAFILYVFVYKVFLLDASSYLRDSITLGSVATFIVVGYLFVLGQEERAHILAFIARRD